jgi:hypothetical protein
VWFIVVLVMTATLGSSGAWAAPAFPTRTQTIELTKGWNAVFLEVEPLRTGPSDVFAGTPIDVAAQFLRPVRTSQFATDPGEILANNEEWGIWYGPDREESFLSSLHAIHSHSAFLVHADSDFTWRITGKVFLKRILWKSDSFNLVGLPVNGSIAPTFAEYFEDVPAHSGQSMFRLIDGIWRKIDKPGETLMRRGEAYWIYSEGGSDYQGPCELKLFYGDHIRYFPDQHRSTFYLRNRSSHPLGVTIKRDGAESFPLDFLFKAILTTGTERFAALLPQDYAMPVMEGGSSGAVTLRVHKASDVEAGAASLLRISSDAGTEYWVAIFAEPTTQQ